MRRRSAALLLVLLPMLFSGALTALEARAAGSGALPIPLETQTPTQTAGSVVEASEAGLEATLPDEVLQARLKEVYANIPALSGVAVEVTSGVVRLRGRVLGAGARQDALEIAAGMNGVVYVVDELELETDLGRTLAPALARLQEYVTTAVRYSPLLLVAVGVVVVFWLLAASIGRRERLFAHTGLNPLLRGLVAQLVRAALVLIGLLIALDLLGATAIVTAVLGTAGLAGLALGFAFRDIVENYLAGVLLSLRQPFSLGDHLQLGEVEGRIVRLTSREMVLMTLDGNHARIPNSTVFSSVMINYTRNPRRRFAFEVGVGMDEDLRAVQQLGAAALRVLPGVLEDPGPQLQVRDLGDFSVILVCSGWVDQREVDFYKVRSEAIKLVKEAFDEAGVTLPEPTSTVRLVRPAAPDAEALPERHPLRSGRAKVPPPLAALSARAQDADVSPDTAFEVSLAEELADPSEPNWLEPPVRDRVPRSR
jgi:small conductance mechanosensitive channel